MDEEQKAKTWIKIIALWSLISTALGIAFYILVQFGVIEETFSKTEIIVFYLGTTLGLLITFGLWNFAAWGWKLTVFSTPLYCIYSIYDLSLNYSIGMGATFSFFIFIEAAIINLLFKSKITNLFNITSSFWSNLEWIKYPLLLMAVFLLGLDLVGSLGSAVITLAIFIGIKVGKKYSTKFQKNNKM